MKQTIESQEDDEEPEEISKPLVTEKPPQTPTSSKIVRKSSEPVKLSRRPSRISGQEDIPPTPPNTSPPASPCNPKTSASRPPPSPNNGSGMNPMSPVSKTSTASINLMSCSAAISSVSISSVGSTGTTPPHSRRASYHRPTLSRHVQMFRPMKIRSVNGICCI